MVCSIDFDIKLTMCKFLAILNNYCILTIECLDIKDVYIIKYDYFPKNEHLSGNIFFFTGNDSHFWFGQMNFFNYVLICFILTILAPLNFLMWKACIQFWFVPWNQTLEWNHEYFIENGRQLRFVHLVVVAKTGSRGTLAYL